MSIQENTYQINTLKEKIEILRYIILNSELKKKCIWDTEEKIIGENNCKKAGKNKSKRSVKKKKCKKNKKNIKKII